MFACYTNAVTHADAYMYMYIYTLPILEHTHTHTHTHCIYTLNNIHVHVYVHVHVCNVQYTVYSCTRTLYIQLVYRPSPIFLLGCLLLYDRDGGHTRQPLLQRLEGGALRQQHQQTVQSPHQSRVLPGVQQLEPQEGKDGGLKKLYQFVDLLQSAGGDFDADEFLDEVGRVFVVL